MDEAYEQLTDGDVLELKQRVSVGRNQIISMTEAGIKTVEPGSFINNNVVDFWMHWIRRKELPNETCAYHFYTS
jgi:Ulp1 family protease